ncbi:MAG: GAF domain-containing protein, partial [Firmicutes bacterium]|nr:GAF domain-containing protein [Bacillota bacterium]
MSGLSKQDTVQDDQGEVARLTKPGAMVLRGIVIVAGICFVLREFALSPAIFVTFVPAGLLVYVFERASQFYGQRVANTMASMADIVIISAAVHLTGGIESHAFPLYFVELIAYSLGDGLVPCAGLGALAAASYGFVALGASSGTRWVLVFRCAVIVLSGSGLNILAQVFRSFAASALTERAECERYARWEHVLARVNREINTGLGIHATLELVLQAGLEVLDAHAGAVVLKNRQGKFVIEAAKNLPPGMLGRTLAPADGCLGLALKRRETVTMPDSSTDPHTIRDMADHGFAAVLATPLFAGKELIGALAFADTEEGTVYTDEDRRLLEALGKQVSVVVANARLLDEARRRADYLSTLNEISRSLSAVLEPERLFEKIYREVERVLPLDAFFVALYHADSFEVEIVFLMDKGKRYQVGRYRLDDGLTSRVIRTGTPLMINRPENEVIEGARTIGDDPEVTRSILIVPMLVGKR